MAGRSGPTLMLQGYPEIDPEQQDEAAEREMGWVMAVILGPMFEQQLAVLTSSYHSVHGVLQRPIADAFLVASLAMLGLRVLRNLRKRPEAAAQP